MPRPTSPSGPGRHRASRPGGALLAAAMMLIGGCAGTATEPPVGAKSPATGLPSASTDATWPATPTAQGPTNRPERAPRPRRPALGESAPVRLRIPKLGVDAGFVELGMTDRRLDTPADPDLVGWFTGAHSPGVTGVAVVAGHVTWDGRNTVFHDLSTLTKGDEVVTDRADGRRITFGVTRTGTFRKDTFPTAEVYRHTDQAEMVLITCGGEYDRVTNSYGSNVIVWATVTGGSGG